MRDGDAPNDVSTLRLRDAALNSNAGSIMNQAFIASPRRRLIARRFSQPIHHRQHPPAGQRSFSQTNDVGVT